MTDKEHMAYCEKRVKMFVEMMNRCYAKTTKKQYLKGEKL